MIGLFIALAATSAASSAVPSLLSPAELVSNELLPPPPAKGSTEARLERDELVAVEKSRTSAELEAAKGDGKTKNASIFRAAIGPAFELDRLPQTSLLMSMVRQTEKAAADRAKDYFKRPRPWIADPSIGACSRNDEPLSSYPSGHTTMAYSMGAILSRLVPERAPAIMARAARYAQNRIVCEVHFRSDVSAGEALGLIVAERLMQKAEFQRQFDRARSELMRVHLTS